MSNQPAHIEPVNFRGGDKPRGGGGRGWAKLLFRVLVLLLILCLGISAWFVFTGRRATIRVEPEPDHVSLRGPWPRIQMGEQLFLRRGSYTVTARKAGYHNLIAPLSIENGIETFTFEMEKLPGRVSMAIHVLNDPARPVGGARVTVDGNPLDGDPTAEHLLVAGDHAVAIQADRFLAYETNLVVEGMDRVQQISIGLTPAWANVAVSAIPSNAVLSVDGADHGMLPVELELLAGPHELLLQAEDYKPFETQLVVRANTPIRLDAIELEYADAFAVIESTPNQALVTVDGVFRGKTPLRTAVRPHEPHRIEVSTAGHRTAEREMILSPNETGTIVLTLEPILALVHFKVDPEGTELFVGGTSRGPTPDRIALTAEKHDIEIRKEGFRPYKATVTPKVDFPQDLVVRLESSVPAAPAPGAVSTIRTSTGYDLRLVPPGSMLMGSSRREQGRRSNETLRRVELKRPFYAGTREITNEEFRAFKPGHNSGTIKATSLNRADQPVVNVRWEDAAAFCNWLSEKDGLDPVYERREKTYVARSPIPNGYRLPTEAEWAYCARHAASGSPLKFAWGNSYPPTQSSGNYGDTTVKGILANHLISYTDGMAVSGAPGSFPANDFGLHDLGGNVAEWCHDPYEIYSRQRGKVFVDPVGPPEGDLHVIRGSSWKKSSMSALRLSYRDYGNEGRNDVGFRVCRYADEPTAKSP